MDVVKQWRCKNNHVLGLVVRNGAGVPQLLLHRHALEAESETPPDEEKMLGPVTGSMPVRCDLCGCKKPWGITVQALLYLVENMSAEHLFQFWNALLKRARVGV